jgi:hypothetical protein
MKNYSNEFIELCNSVTAKRPKIVIEHILKHDFITTEELKNTYGYNHPPRAVRDVREHGIPIETFRVIGKDGRKIAAYRFGEFKKLRFTKQAGRTGLSKAIKEKLIEKYGSKCFIYQQKIDERELQIDHRVPFEVEGDIKGIEQRFDDFMLLSCSANRAKSWSCEHCENWNNMKDKEICFTCYWAYPESYNHIAMKQIRRVDIMWQGDEVAKYDELKKKAVASKQEIPDFIKEIIEIALTKNR